MCAPPTLLVDRNNIDEVLPGLLEVLRRTQFVGVDCETQDDGRHAGLNALMNVDAETREKSKAKRLVFDMRRTVMTGFSVYPEGHDTAYYFNLAHADLGNRLDWAQVAAIFDRQGFWVAHNATYEKICFHMCHALDLERLICTMQLSVTAFGDDNYDVKTFDMAPLGALSKWQRTFYAGTDAQKEDAISKILAKESKAEHSMNGFVKDIAYGHGLKQLVQRFFDYKMTTFDEVMGDAAHMGQLTGAQVASYGAEDAYWVIPLFRKLMEHVALHSPDALPMFFDQENPMIDVFADLQIGGMRVNLAAIEKRRDEERESYAHLLRDLRVALRQFEGFPSDPHPDLARKEPWYANGRDKYLALWKWWINLDEEDDHFEETQRVSAAVPNAWAVERGLKRGKGLFSIQHYMPQRVLLYDMLRCPMIWDMGKVQSDGEARGKMKTEATDERVIAVIDILSAMASLDTRMKLYLTPYMHLTDPETQRLYPTVNCLLNSRRLAASTPNPMQLAKRGESTYVRGFFLGDTDEHLIVSLDWSAIELVIIGEESGDPQFAKAFAQAPHEDLHAGAAVSVLQADIPGLTEEMFDAIKAFEHAEHFAREYSLNDKERIRLFTNLKGEDITPVKVKSYWRTEVGKGANFNYWYSGFLTTVGERMGWDMEKTGRATEKYRERFAVAEEWRVNEIHKLQKTGYVELPDGHRRFRHEATREWADSFAAKWATAGPDDHRLDPMIADSVNQVIRRTQRRANNQGINSIVQGTCATLMKRSILTMRREVLPQFDARFLIPIHDEKVYSVHHSIVPEFVTATREVMINHPDLFPKLKLDATPAVGRTFEPWHKTKAPFGQIELFEPPEEIVGKDLAGKRLTEDQMRVVVDYLMKS